MHINYYVATYLASAGGSEVSRESNEGIGYDSKIIASNIHSNSKDTLDLAVCNQTNMNVSGDERCICVCRN